MPGIHYESQIKMFVPPTEDNHVVRKAELAATMRKGVSGTYTQGIDFDGAGLLTFQQWLDVNVNNRYFDADVVININTANTTPIIISNVLFASPSSNPANSCLLYIYATQKIASTLRVSGLHGVGDIRIRCYGASVKAYDSGIFHDCVASRIYGSGIFGNTTVSGSGRFMVGIDSATDQHGTIVESLTIGDISNLLLSNVYPKTIQSLTNNGTIIIDSAANVTLPATISGRGEIIDNRLGFPFDTFTRTASKPVIQGIAGTYTLDSTTLGDLTVQQWFDANVNNRYFNVNSVINIVTAVTANLNVYNVTSANNANITINVNAQISATFQIRGCYAEIIVNSALPVAANALYMVGVRRVALRGTTSYGNSYVYDVNQLYVDSGANITISGASFQIGQPSCLTIIGRLNVTEFVNNGIVTIPVTGILNQNTVSGNGIWVDQRPGNPLDTFLRSGASNQLEASTIAQFASFFDLCQSVPSFQSRSYAVSGDALPITWTDLPPEFLALASRNGLVQIEIKRQNGTRMYVEFTLGITTNINYTVPPAPGLPTPSLPAANTLPRWYRLHGLSGVWNLGGWRRYVTDDLIVVPKDTLSGRNDILATEGQVGNALDTMFNFFMNYINETPSNPLFSVLLPWGYWNFDTFFKTLEHGDKTFAEPIGDRNMVVLASPIPINNTPGTAGTRADVAPRTIHGKYGPMALTFQGAGTVQSAGIQYGSCLYLSPKADFSTAFNPSGDLTVALWMKELVIGGSRGCPFCNWETGGIGMQFQANGAWIWQSYNGTNKTGSPGTGAGYQTFTVNDALNTWMKLPQDGEWHHFCFKYTESDRTVRFYIDGVNMADPTDSGTEIAVGDPGGIGRLIHPHRLVWGTVRFGLTFGANPDQLKQGDAGIPSSVSSIAHNLAIDEVWMFDRAITDAELDRIIANA